MSGANPEIVVQVTYGGVPCVIDGPVCEDWTDDDPTRLRVSFYIHNPGGPAAVDMPELCPECGTGTVVEKMSGVECSVQCGWWFCF